MSDPGTSLYEGKAWAGPDQVVPLGVPVSLRASKAYLNWRSTTPGSLTYPDTIQAYRWKIVRVPDGHSSRLMIPNGWLYYGSVEAGVSGDVNTHLFTWTGDDSIAIRKYNGTIGEQIVLSPGDGIYSPLLGEMLIVVGTGPRITHSIGVTEDFSQYFDVSVIVGSTVDDPGFTTYRPRAGSLWFPDGLAPYVGEFQEGDIVIIRGIPCVITLVDWGSDQVYFDRYFEFVAGGDPIGDVWFLRQDFITPNRGEGTAYATFDPELPGIYVARNEAFRPWPTPTFEPHTLSTDYAVINVVDQPTELNLPVDASWVWRYLSDFWSTVHDRQWVEAAWRSLIRSSGAGLIDSWNLQISSTLLGAEDIAKKRWIGFDAAVSEPNPPAVILNKRFRPVCSNEIDDGTTYDVELTIYDQETPTVIRLSALGSGFVSAWTTALETAGFAEAIIVQRKLFTGGTTGTPLSAEIVSFRSESYVIEVCEYSGANLFLDPTRPVSNLFNSGPETYRTGEWLSTSTFALSPARDGTDYVLGTNDGCGHLRAGDPINICGRCHTITGIHCLTGGEWGFDPTLPVSAVTVDPPLETPDYLSTGCPWSIPPFFKSPEINYRYELFAPGDGALVVLRDAVGDSTEIDVVVMSEGPYMLGTEDERLYWTGYTPELSQAIRFFHVPADDTVLSIPALKANPDSVKGWIEGVDFVVGTYRDRRAIIFDYLDDRWFIPDPGSYPYPYQRVRSGTWNPSDRYWAELVYIDQKPFLSERFGSRLGLTEEQIPFQARYNYARALMGLWYCYFHGPKPEYLERGLSIILGVPVFEADGTIIDMFPISDFMSVLLVRDTAEQEIIRTYIVNTEFGLATNPETGSPYVLGDAGHQFDPIILAAEYRDYINDPLYMKALIAADIITEPEKTHTFSVAMEATSFTGWTADSLSAAISFLETFKVTHSRGLFFLLIRLMDELNIYASATIGVVLPLVSYLGQRWGAPRYDRGQMGGGTHSYYDGLLASTEGYVALLYIDGMTSQFRVKFYHKPTDFVLPIPPTTPTDLLDPLKYGMQANDILYLPDPDIPGDWLEVPISSVVGGASGYVVVPDPGTSWGGWVEDFAVMNNPSFNTTKIWSGYDDADVYPRNHVEIELIPGGTTVVADYPGVEQ